MRKLLFVFLIYSLNSYSMTKDVFNNKYDQIRKELDVKVNECLQQNDQVVKKAVTNIENAKNKDEYVEFVKDENKAINFIQSLDLKKRDTHFYENKLTQLMINNCTGPNLKLYMSLEKDRKYCAEIFDELSFMKALIFATKNYAWSKQTKEMAKNKIFDYIKHLSNIDKTPLVSQMIPLSLLQTMMEYGLIDNSLKQDIIVANENANQLMSKFKEELKNNKIKDIERYNCNSFKKFSTRELNYSSKVQIFLKTLLKKILK
ncbi:MAG: hypothetical protein A2202_00885 [Bdellovibrionales bacterium RIFOXYA1_FULL_36_14]|nr:MAG: hypothetical protein A2202_00885 [Bdellovibrionales bacterium RIFOXYA1_FULL_36_14]